MKRWVDRLTERLVPILFILPIYANVKTMKVNHWEYQNIVAIEYQNTSEVLDRFVYMYLITATLVTSISKILS